MKLFSLLLSSLCAASVASAQTFDALTPFSKYECITFSDGTTGVSMKASWGHQIVHSSSASKEIATRQKNLRLKRQTLNSLRKEVKKGTFDQKDTRKVSEMLNEAFAEENSPELKEILAKHKKKLKTRDDRLSAIDSLLDDIESDLSGTKQELDALKDCTGGVGKQKGLPVRLIPFNEYGTPWRIFAVADVEAKKKPKKGYAYLYCVKRGTLAFQTYFSKDPCSLVSGQTSYGRCPYAAGKGANVLTGIVGNGSQSSGSDTKTSDEIIKELLISSYPNWKNVTVEAKPAGRLDDCYKLFKMD